MASYLSDGIRVYVEKLIDWDSYFRLKKGEDVDVEAEKGAILGVLEAAAEICQDIETESRAGWAEPARIVDGMVVFPAHVAHGYERLREAGLVSLSVSEKYGGFDLPSFVANIVLQMVARADAALMTIVGLQAGVAEDIQRYGSEEICQEYLPRFASGEVQGAMDLTEPQAGSDLGAITTRATEADGQIFLDGQKVFITNGGAEIHLVLARDAQGFDQSRGTTKGLSLFVCPRSLADGTPNGVGVERLEHKLGIHGSPTAVVCFEHAQAFRIGNKGEGFKAMLDLMNNARLGVAGQGIGIAEAALHEALAYARERKQFGGPIGDQPLMKSMLSRMVLYVEASRALLYRCTTLVDQNQAIEAFLARESDLSEAERESYREEHDRNSIRIRLLTPLAKYLATEYCDSVTRNAIQVHGGLGFMEESVAGRLHLDGIITTIYEGTSEIQVSFALKEIGRGALQVVFEQLERELETMTEAPLREFADKVRAGIAAINEASASLIADPGYALLSARDVGEMVIHVIVGTELLRQAQADPERLDLAVSWVNLKMLELAMYARRVSEGDGSRVERCERIIDLHR